MKNQLYLNQKVIDNCFVSDAIRLSKLDDTTKIDLKKNRELIWGEIELLKPNLVICVGNYAREIVGMRYSSHTKFHHIPFPTHRKSKSEKVKDLELYKELEQIYEDSWRS